MLLPLRTTPSVAEQGGTADRNRSHWSTSKTPSYTKSVSWQHHRVILSMKWL
ncbi:putative IS1 encoded protein [Escherichia coli E267]|nr:putative IS1 encoded protein [Escherichia coli E267]